MTSSRQTRFSDVCGTIDELKRLLCEEAELDRPRELLVSYVEDCLAMLGRMEARLSEFTAFRHELRELLEQLERIEEGAQQSAETAAEALVRRFSVARPLTGDDVERLCARAETVRDAANLAEDRLRRFKQAAMAVGRLYSAVEGGRGWQREGEDAASAGIEPHLAAWLPRSPHREKILEWLAADRARLVCSEGTPPVVAFEDGGMIPLKQVRWSEEVANFVPASFRPNPRGLRYRPKA